MEDKGQLSKLDTSTGVDGKTYPRKPISVFNPTKREERTMKNPEVIERMREDGTNALTAEKELHREEKAERKTYFPE